MKVLILTTVMAPYRVTLFDRLGMKCDLTVCFEQCKDKTRADDWYEKKFDNFSCIPLKKWQEDLKTTKFEILKIARELKPDLVIAYEYSTKTAMLLMSYCKMMNIPYVINCDGAFVKKSYKDCIKKFFIQNASGYLASGEMAEKYFLNYGAKRENIYFHKFTTLFDDDICKELISPAEKENLRNKLNMKHTLNILSVGRFIYQKGIDVLLKSAKEIPTDVGIYIVGGIARQEYKDLLKELNLDNVYFVDFMKPDKLKEYFLAADVFVFPTRYDVWGLVVNEAMAYGLPVVTTDMCVAGLELIEDGINGYIVPIDDEKKLADAINVLLENEENTQIIRKANLLKIREYTVEKSADTIYDTLLKIYSKSVKK